jgi:Ca-activated chloride channel family protein
MLALALLPLAWAAWEWRSSRRRAALLLKAISFSIILLALAEPRWQSFEQRSGIAILVDASASIPAEQLALERQLAERLQDAASDSVVRVIDFDSGIRRAADVAVDANPTSGTDLELAIQGALSALPPERAPRIALLSDGLENLGVVERAVERARQRGVPIDTIALPGRSAPQLQLLAADAPAQVYSGELFPIDFAIESPSDADVDIRLEADGVSIGSSQGHLRPGTNYLRAQARLRSNGAVVISGVIDGGQAGELAFARALRMAQPRALVLTDSASGGHIESVLQASDFEIDLRRRSDAPLRQAYDLVVADNQDFEHWPARFKTELEAFVASGGGFLLVAGEQNLYAEHVENASDPLQRMLPANLAPPRTPESTAVVLVLDKSSSMEGRKMDLARQSAMGVVDNLREVDQVGVLVFDNTFEWAIPIRTNDDPRQLKQLIAGVIADGGTQIAPALKEAYENILPRQAVYRHILLLTDGISEEGDSLQVAKLAVDQTVTISTIGLGRDVNRSYLERIAQTALGRFYAVLDVSQLAQVVLRDVLEHTGSSLSEQEFRPLVLQDADLLEGVSLSSVGPLLGRVRFESKPSAETILAVDDEERDPLLVRWQYGVGRAAVFTSDARDRWAANWTTWNGFDRFWGNIARDLLPRTPREQVDVHFERASRELVAVYHPAGDAPTELPLMLISGPNGFRATAQVERVSANVYECRAAIGDRFGLFRVRSAQPIDGFPESGLYRQNDELATYGSDPDLLRRIATATGGLFNPTPEQTAAANPPAVRTQFDLWPWLLLLGLILNLAEVAGRKGWLPWLSRWL